MSLNLIEIKKVLDRMINPDLEDPPNETDLMKFVYILHNLSDKDIDQLKEYFLSNADIELLKILKKK